MEARAGATRESKAMGRKSKPGSQVGLSEGDVRQEAVVVRREGSYP